jgi:cellulose synthase operon protein C
VAVRLVNVRLLAGEGKLPEARAELDRVIAAHADAAEAWQLKGELQTLAEAPAPETAESFRKAVSLDKRLIGAHAGLINTLMRANDKAAAKEALVAMKAVAAQHPQTLYFTAVFALDEGQLKQATEAVQALLKLTPENERALFLAGRVAQANGDTRQAEANFAKVVQAYPNHVQARVALAQTQLRGGDPAQAATTLQPALDAPGGASGEALSLAAEIALKQGKGDQAEKLLGRAAEANPKDVRSRVALALGQIGKGQEAQGLAALRQLTAEDKTDSADLALISVLMRKRDWDGAGKAIDAFEKKRPQAATAPELRGRIALFRGDRAGARRQFEEAQKREPGALEPASNLAAMDLQDKNAKAGLARFDGVIKADPKNVRAHMAQIGLGVTQKLITAD